MHESGAGQDCEPCESPRGFSWAQTSAGQAQDEAPRRSYIQGAYTPPWGNAPLLMRDIGSAVSSDRSCAEQAGDGHGRKAGASGVRRAGGLPATTSQRAHTTQESRWMC